MKVLLTSENKQYARKHVYPKLVVKIKYYAYIDL